MKKAIFVFISLLATILWGQGLAGDATNRARNDHSGNLIRVTFYNHGMLGSIQGDQSLVYGGEWPINSGQVQMGNASSYVMSEMQAFAGLDSNGDSLFEFITPAVFCQGWDPNAFAHDSLGNFLGFEPISGYYSLSNKESDPFHAIAMSHQAYTWPAYWPDKLDDPIDPGWGGHWNGYFGKDQKNSDQESYYVMDDYQYKKLIRGIALPSPVAAQPDRGGLGLRQEVRGLQWSNPDAEDCIFWIYSIENIGEINHYKTVFGLNVGASMGALLTGNTDYDDDAATFFRDIDLTVNYDWDNVGTGGYQPVPWVGFAFLESPGNAFDGIDNDGDGALGGGKLLQQSDFVSSYSEGDDIVVIDYDSETYERHIEQMPAVYNLTIRGKTYPKAAGTPLQEIERNGIDDNLNGLIDESDGAMDPDSTWFYLYLRDPVYNNQDYLAIDYFNGDGMANLLIDERRDDGIDNDGDWDPNIDDVGLDGKPATGDEGEGDGLPTPGSGNLPGEPSIDVTDVNESDQIGLTSFIFYEYGAITYDNDDAMWEASRPGFFDGHLENVDADYIFSCGYFPLQPEQNEFLSVAMIYGEDEEDILRNKTTVQKIYDSNYNFAVAPEKPTLRAVAGDNKVTLYWDSFAEGSFDRFLKSYDFEGYKIYKAKDPGFEDAGSITDGFGYPHYTRPIAQYDVVDSVFGFFPATFGRGVQFNLGNETGLVHTYIDSPLVNGQRYFYAVTAYDKGDLDKNISPSETNKYVTVDAAGNVRTGVNVVAITPNAPSVGYTDAGFSIEPRFKGDGLTMGSMGVRILNPDSIVDGDRYEVQFLDQAMDGIDNDHDQLVDALDPDELLPTLTTGFVVKNVTNSSIVDTVWIWDYKDEGDSIRLITDLYDDNDGNPNTLRAIVEGLEFNVYNPESVNLNLPDQDIYFGTKWSDNLNYYTSYNIKFDIFKLGGFRPGIPFPRQYMVVFHDDIVGQSSFLGVPLASTGSLIPLPARDVAFQVIDQRTGEEVPFAFVDASVDPSITAPGQYSAKDNIILFEYLEEIDSTVITYSILNNDVQDTVFQQLNGRGLGDGDTLWLYPDYSFTRYSEFEFEVFGQSISPNLGAESLDNIKVVPNPYVVSASWEPKNPYSSGRGPRIIQFIHLPQKCTIRIFSVDGSLVRTLDHDAPMRDGSETWDMLTKDNMDISYGVYIYHIDAPGIGEKIGRMLIIK